MLKAGFLDSGGGVGKKKTSNIVASSRSGSDPGFPPLVDGMGTVHIQDGELNPMPLTKANLRKLDVDVPNNADYDIWLPLASVDEEKYGFKKVTTVKGFFFFQFSSNEAVDSVLRDGLWMIRGVPIFLNKWSPSVSLLKEELSRVPVWVNFHDVLMVVYTMDGLSLIASKIGTPVMLDSYTNTMCLESWGKRSYARILIEIDACNDFYDLMVMDVPNVEATKRVVNRVDKGKSSEVDDEGFTEVKRKKSGGNNSGTKNVKPVLVKPKTTFRPKVNQPTAKASPKKATSSKSIKTASMRNVSTSCNHTVSVSNWFDALNDDNLVTEEAKSVSKDSTSVIHVVGQSSTPIVDKINRIEKHLMGGKCVLVGDDSKPLEKVDSMVDHDNDDESLLEQWNESYENADYDYDPYDNDMYEGQDIPDNLHAIADKLNIKVRGRNKK
ncbi:hypothetical protein Tco_1546847 [Tanacetum coccineum]